MTSWILVRHGATDWNRDGRYQGQADPPLNEEGLAQAIRLARQLEKQTIEAVFSSDLRRARDTAEHIARLQGLPVHLDARLREVNQGEWEGILVDEIAAGFPEAWRAIKEDPLHARAPGGESAADVAERAMSCLKEIAGSFAEGPVAVVSHGLTLACVLCTMDSIPLEQVRERIPPNGTAVERQWPRGA